MLSDEQRSQALAAAEQVSALAYSSTQPPTTVALVALRWLGTATDEFYAECPQESAGIAVIALENGASWQEVAQAARIPVSEAQQHWSASAPATVSATGVWGGS